MGEVGAVAEAAGWAVEAAEAPLGRRGGRKEGRKGLVIQGWLRMFSSFILWVGMIWRHWLIRSWHSARESENGSSDCHFLGFKLFLTKS